MYPIRTMDEIESLRHRLDYVTLVTEALWSFFVDQGYEEQQLVDRIASIDLSDGRLDHRHAHHATCGNCGAAVAGDRCQFCGAKVNDPFALS
jgi:succinate dehydrogenase/fumarate reductase-like Fe-S protein